MTLEDFILYVFCLVDDTLGQMHLRNVRQRGPAPTLSDSEVLTIEIVGEFLEMDKDSRIFWHFRKYHSDAFPGLRRIHRSTFVRQAANLWVVKQILQQRLSYSLTCDDRYWHVDSMPLDVCRFARATYCQRFGGEAAYGRDWVARQTFYGFRLHLRISSLGIIQAVTLAPANVADTEAIWELNLPEETVGFGDRNYWSPTLFDELAEGGVVLIAPYRNKSHDPNPVRSRQLSKLHRLVETVNGQLAQHYHVKRTWTRDLWHLGARIIRKVLSHTIAAWICVRVAGLNPLEHAALITE